MGALGLGVMTVIALYAVAVTWDRAWVLRLLICGLFTALALPLGLVQY